ncbi:MAG: hypothetical protein IPH54_15355 [Rhodoferax sp.]|nr:hypothetical protein [Rhodoferax sp.]
MSQSLPVRSEPFDDRATRPFFAGLRPKAASANRSPNPQVSTQNDCARWKVWVANAGAVTSLEPPVAPSWMPREWLAGWTMLNCRLLDEMPLRPMRAGTTACVSR